MDESTVRGMKLLDLNDNNTGAASRKTRIPHTVISVEGYDTWVHEYTLKLALRKHFSSCGKVTHVYTPRDFKKRGCILKSVAFMWITGEDCLDKALELSGTDVGGWIVTVKAAPPQQEFQDRAHRPIEKPLTVCVTGYDTSLPEIDLQLALCDHFSSCGEVNKVNVILGSAYIYLFGGEKSVGKALELSGCNMGEMNLVVEPHPPAIQPPSRSPSPPHSRRRRLPPSRSTAVGYTPLSSLLRGAEKRKMEIELEMDKKKKKKMKTQLMWIEEQIKKKMETEEKM